MVGINSGGGKRLPRDPNVKIEKVLRSSFISL